MKTKTIAVLIAVLVLAVAGGRALADRLDDGRDTGTGVVHQLPPATLQELPSRSGEYDIINGSDASLALILGGDDREQVTNTSNFPNSSVTLIEAWDDGSNTVFLCTAAFVGPNVLLTAAHCLWIPEFGGFPDGVAIAPGANGNATPFGVEAAGEVWVPDDWINAAGEINDAYPYDYGLIVLDSDDLGNEVGAFTVGVLNSAELRAADFNPSTAGYPGDKPFGTQWFGSGVALDTVYQQVLAHPMDVYFGQSGSPLWRGSDLALVGVISFETPYENFALRITEDVMEDLNDACDGLGCRINHFGLVSPEPIETPTPMPRESPTDPGISGDLSAIDRTWERTDRPVAEGAINRTWMWGPATGDLRVEPYGDGGESRTVRYYEKSRMEITNPDGDPNSIWYVTNGRLAWELVTGQLQLGDARFEGRVPASINVAGDPDNPAGPTYATFTGLLDAAPHAFGAPITTMVDRAGVLVDDPALASFDVVAARYVSETDHMVASVFWDFMNSSGLVYEAGVVKDDLLFENPFFATGLPITEPYWTTVQVGGSERTVLVQVFERRVLTFTPGNGVGWEVEAGNVGLHYHAWRYDDS